MKSFLNTSDKNLNIGFRLPAVKNSADAEAWSLSQILKNATFQSCLFECLFLKTVFSDAFLLLLIDLKATASLRLFRMALFHSDSICRTLLLHVTLVSMLYRAFLFYALSWRWKWKEAKKEVGSSRALFLQSLTYQRARNVKSESINASKLY